MLWFLVSMIVVGLIAGFVARAPVPGNDNMSIGGTIALGIVGSLIGGFLGYLILGRGLASGTFQTSGLLGYIIGAIIVLLVLHTLERPKV